VCMRIDVKNNKTLALLQQRMVEQREIKMQMKNFEKGFSQQFFGVSQYSLFLMMKASRKTIVLSVC
jgi:hypothetical protein